MLNVEFTGYRYFWA